MAATEVDIEDQALELETQGDHSEETFYESTSESDRGDPFHPREGRDLVWKHINMTLDTKDGKPKQILDDVWGEVPKGHVTAIMGPSGSGKTSLLNILAGRARSQGIIKISSDVRLNNYQVDPTDMEVRKKIAFVAQDDSLQVTATPREAISFSARLRLPQTMSNEEIESLTTKMIEELGLTKCSDVVVGGELLKGISGGERKRTSVGVELVTRPALVFLDEPTSGLDSFNAVQLCQLLGKVATAGSSVLFTIHQPSSDIFNAFDRLILLNTGRVMYQGSVADVPKYFADRGFPNPPNYNPADWILKVALSEPAGSLDKAGFFACDDREFSKPFISTEGLHKDALGFTTHTEEGEDLTPAGMGTQVSLLFRRELKNLCRATHALKARTGMTVMISLLIGLLFFQVGDEDYSDFITVQSTFGALLMGLISTIFATALPSLTTFPEERPVFLREYATNHYSVVAYMVSRLTMELGLCAMQVTVGSAMTYLLVGYSGSFLLYWTGMYLMAMTSTALAAMLGSSVENPSVAIELLPAVFLPQVYFAGFFVPPGLMPDWLSWLRHIFPLTYGVKIIITNELDGRCEGLTPNNCDIVMGNIGAERDEVWWYYLVLVGLFILCRLLAVRTLKAKASKFY